MKICILGSSPSKPTYTASNPPQPTVKHHIQRKTKFTPWSNGATPSGCSTNLTRRRATHNKTSPRARCYVRGRTTIPWWLILLNRRFTLCPKPTSIRQRSSTLLLFIPLGSNHYDFIWLHNLTGCNHTEWME